jgi:hypothetical protein
VLVSFLSFAAVAMSGCGGKASGDSNSAPRFGPSDGSIAIAPDSSDGGIDTAPDSNRGRDATAVATDGNPDATEGDIDAAADPRSAIADAASGGYVATSPDATTAPSVVDASRHAAPCNKATCPAGCCDAEGICQPGTYVSLCGGGGAACTSCEPQGGSGPNLHCVDQQCTASAQASCACPAGCCDSLGACQPGTSNTACGKASSCTNCTASGQSAWYPIGQ